MLARPEMSMLLCDLDVEKGARSRCDRRFAKAILESAQIASTGLNEKE